MSPNTHIRFRRAAAAAALVALVFAAAACGSGDVQPGATDSEVDLSYSKGESDLVLRIELSGGFLPVEAIFTTVPSFSLYGDGRVIFPGPMIEIYPGPALPNLQQVQLTEEGVARLLEEARAVNLLNEGIDLGQPPVADAPNTVFTVTVGDRTYETTAYALGYEPEGLGEPGAEPGETPPSGQTEPGSSGAGSSGNGGEGEVTQSEPSSGQTEPLAPETAVSEDTLPGEQISSGTLTPAQRESRRKLIEFQAKLFDLRGFLGDEAGLEEEYVFPAIGILSIEGDVSQPDDSGIQPTVVRWPLGDLATLGEPEQASGGRSFVVTGDDLELIRPLLRNANTLTFWESEGKTYRLHLRPLLPDEVAALK